MKAGIEQALREGDCSAVWEKIKEYEKARPKDYELFSYYTAYYLMCNDIDHALIYSERAIRINPFDLEANYNYAVCLDQHGDVAAAYDYYIRANYLLNYYQMDTLPKDVLEARVEELHRLALENGLQDDINYVDARFHYAIRDPFRNPGQDVIGKILMDTYHQAYYIGRNNSWYDAYFSPESNLDMIHAKCEIIPIDVFDYSCHAGGKGYRELLPVVLNPEDSEKKGNYILDTGISFEKAYEEPASKKWAYIPLEKEAYLETAFPAVFGRAIPLEQTRSADKKRLVLNIFIDSFNEKLIKEYGLKTLMPHTYRYFQNGTECTRYYSCSEYTLPSIATYWTGKLPSNHMNLLNEFRYDFMGDQKVLPEYFKDAGYVTAKIGGNDAVTPAQGYMRGMDRFIYQLASEGQTVKDVIMDTIEHLETFKETNQFVWMEIVDLHDVAGGFMRSLEVQAKVPLETRFIDNDIKTTVQQTRSQNREDIYIQELRKIDLYLSLMYHYLNENYADEELVVTLFSDHGTAFLVDNEEPFVSHQRTNIPLLVKAAGVMSGECDEVIQTTDYAAIVCRLANIPYALDESDGNLPRAFGGEHSRDFAFTQSIFLGDKYYAGVHGIDMHCYYETEHPTEAGFHIKTKNARLWAVNDAGEQLSEGVDLDFYRSYIEDKIGHLVIYERDEV